jgi:integrase
MWVCKNTECRNEAGKHRGYKKVCTGEKKASCKHCGAPMVLNESYTARVHVGGECITRVVGNKKESEEYVGEVKKAARLGKLLPGEEVMIPWPEAVRRFKLWLDDPANGIRPETVKFYRNMLKPFDAAFGKKTLQAIEKDDVEAFKAARMKDCSASTVNGSLATLKRLYGVICSSEKAAKTPRLHEAKEDIFKVKLLKLDNQVETILETQEEVEVLLSFCKTPHLYHFVYGIMNTGLRHVDMLKLKIQEVSLQRNEIATTVKGGAKVRIPLTGEYRAYLEEWLKRDKVARISGYLIPSNVATGECFKLCSNIGFKTACEKAAAYFEAKGNKDAARRFRELTPHCLRHTFASHWLYKTSKELGATAAIHILSEILGHSSSYITQRYSHALQDVQQSAMKVFGEKMFSSK